MTYQAEQYFVLTFIRKSRRERLLFELTSPKKRYDGISRFCHQAEDVLDHSKIIMTGEDMDRLPEFQKFVRMHDEPCFILSPDGFIDGQHVPLKDAVEMAVMCPDAAVMIGSSYAIVFGESSKGGRGKYLLSEHKKQL
ncbi:MAG TPA: hypothetical protein DCG51_02560 [Erysipelotrichaceae bacterium]|nr:hypothetical protein [Erysipelotrichaceae bacterium]